MEIRRLLMRYDFFHRRELISDKAIKCTLQHFGEFYLEIAWLWWSTVGNVDGAIAGTVKVIAMCT